MDAVEEVEAEAEVKPHQDLQHLQDPNTKGPGIQISQLVTGQGARCTIGGVGVHFSVLSLEHVLGGTFSHQSQQNEPGTSPRSTTNFMTI